MHLLKFYIYIYIRIFLQLALKKKTLLAQNSMDVHHDIMIRFIGLRLNNACKKIQNTLPCSSKDQIVRVI